MKQSFCVMTATAAIAFMGLASAHTERVQYQNIQIATVLSEVQRGSVDGRDYLTIHIDGEPTGPAACRSNVLKVETGPAANSGREDSIEAVALSALLNHDPVMITIPLDPAECYHGRPTFTDLYLLPASP